MREIRLRTPYRFQRSRVAAAVVACFCVEVGYGNPTGPAVVNGQVTFARTGGVLSVTNSPSSIINWQQFSIGRGETTRFIQQSAASAVLNRVVGADPSSILGTLQSNGRVFLINPSGIVFGAGARIDTAGLVASTLNLSNEDFLGGRLRFTGDPARAAAVVNQGRIAASEGGRVFLVGAAVDNQGTITAPNGDIVLAAGRSVRITEGAGSALQVEIKAPADSSVNLSEAVYGSRGIYGGLVRNSGVISADAAVSVGGRIMLKASGDTKLAAGSRASAAGASGGVVSVEAGNTATVSGTLDASGAIGAGGGIALKAANDLTLDSRSTLKASGASGGTIAVQAETGTLVTQGVIEAKGIDGPGGAIHLLGERVALLPRTRVDVSGETGGGTVLVGGDYQGGNPGVKNSTFTFVGTDVTLSADALTDGNGGKVVVWADDTTRFGGTISARGGLQGGDGGFVEVSGKQTLMFRGRVDTRAPRGTDGMLLLDPADITILNGTGNGTGDGDVSTASFTGNPSGTLGTVLAGDTGPSTIFESELQGIAATTSVSIAASNGIVINDLTDNLLTFAQTSPRTVTLTAGGGGISMNVGDTIQTGGGALNITTTGAATLGGLTSGGGAITINVGAASSVAGVVAGAGTTLAKQGGGMLTLSGANTYTGATTISAGTLRAANAAALGTTAGATTIANGATLDINGVAIGAEALNVQGTGVGGNGAITNTGTGSLSGGITLAGNTTIGGAGTLTLSGVINDGGANNFSLTKTGAGTLVLTSANTYGTGTNVNQGVLNLRNNGAAGNAGTVIVANGAALELQGGITVGRALTLNGTGIAGAGALRNVTGANTWSGAITLASASRVNSDAGTLTLSGGVTGAAQNLTVGGAGNTTVSTVIGTTTGTLTKDGAGTLTLSAANTYTGTTTISAGTLALGAANRIADASAVTVAGGATFNLAGFAETVGSIAGAGNITLGAGTLSAGGNNSSTTFSGVVSGAGGLTKLGTGTLTLSGANTYTGTTTISAGTLRLAGGSAIADTGAVTLANVAGAILDLNGTAETIGSLAGGGATGGNVTLGAATLSAGGSNATTTYTGVVSGTGGLTKQGTGTLTLAGANTYTGTTTISAGTLALGAANRIADASAVTVAGGATFNLAGFAETVGSIAGAGNITLGAGTLSAGGDNSSTTFSGVVSGAGGLTKLGTGTLTLSGASTYTGVTTASAGTLSVNSIANVAGGASALGAPATVANGTVALGAATLQYTGTGHGSNRVINLTGTGSVDASGSGALTLTGGITGAAQNLTLAGTGSGVESGIVNTTTGTVTKTGAGAWTLSGANTYTGTTTVSAGTLSAASATALGTTAGSTTVANGATLQIANVAIGAEAVTLNGNGVGAAGALTGTGTASLSGMVALASASRIGAAGGNSLTLAGSIEGPGALEILGGGTVTLGGTVGSGTALASFGGTAGTTLAINGGLVRTTGGQTYGATTFGAPATLRTTAGGSISASGAITATAGTLTLDTGTGNATFGNGSNDFATVAVTSGGAVTLVDSNALTLGSSTLGSLQAQTLSNDLTVGGTITASGTGDSIVLAAAQNFINTVGAGALNPGPGRWLVYSTSPAGSTENGLVGAAGSALPRLYNRTFGGSPPASVTEPGNHLIYSSQPALTVTPDNKTKVYGTNDPAQTYVAAGFINDDGVMDNAVTAGLTGSFGRVAGETVAAPGPTYTITQGAFASNAGYSISFTGGQTLTITPAAVTATLTPPGQTKAYGTNDPALPGLTLSGVVNTTVTDWNGNNTVINDTGNVTQSLMSLTRAAGETVAGSPYAITSGVLGALGGSAAGNYSSTGALSLANSPTLTITKANLTASIANQTKVYGADDPALAGVGVALGGVVNNGSIATWNGNVAVNDTGNVAATLASLTRNAGETVAGSPYDITAATFNALTGAAAGNYNAPALTGVPTLTITPAALTASIANQTKTYGTDDPALGGIAVTLGGVVNRTVSTWNGNVAVNDTGNVATTLASLSRDVGETVAGSPYNITGATFNALTGAAAGNYNAPGFTGTPTLTITPVALTASIANQTKMYGADDPVVGGIAVTLGGVVNRTISTWNGNVAVNDTGNVAATLASLTRDAGETVGGSPYAITGGVLGALGGSAAGNYSSTGALSLANTPTLTITPAALTASIANQTKTYGADDPALGGIAVTLGGLVNRTVATWNGPVVVNDSALTGTATALTRDVGEGVGVRAITAGTFSAPSANYSAPTLAGGSTLTIDAAPLTFARATPGQSKVYGADDPMVGGVGATLTGLVNRTVATWNGNVGVNDSAVTGTLTSLTRAAGETVAGSPYAITTGAVTLSASDANYAKSLDATNNPTLTITRAPMSVAANAQSKTYGAADPALTYGAAGLVNATVNDWNGNGTTINDTVSSAFSGALARAPGETVAGSPYAISQGTLAANGNYNVTSFTGSALTVLPAPLTITVNNALRPVNQPDPPFSATYAGFQLGETPAVLTGALGFSTTAALSSPAGQYPIVPFGQSSTNYAITYVNGFLTVTGAMPQLPVNPGNAGSFVPLSISELATNLVISGFQQLGGGAVYWGLGECSGGSTWAPIACVAGTIEHQK